MHTAHRPSHLRAKRVVDVVLALVLIVLTAPLMVTVAVLVAVRLGRPVIFRQCRPGRGGRPFEVLKFRSMLEPDPARGLVSDADRLTGFGIALRSTSLDELPSLVNILRGEMSFVGPRPLMSDQIAATPDEERRRHAVRPGLTGLAQVSGRNNLSKRERLRLDLEYVERRSALLDVQILFRTLVVVLRRDGVTAPGYVSGIEQRVGTDRIPTAA